MSVMRALLWKEWRQVRWDMLVLSAFGIGFAAWGGIEVAMGSERWNDATLVGIACFLLPGAAIVLGATTTAGDKALSFAGARPASATARVVTRLGVRMAALAIVFASSGIAVTIALGARMGSTLAGWAPGRGQGSIVVVLGAWLLCCFASAALASAF